MSLSLDQRLRGSRRGEIALELFGNAIHFPLANIFLEMLLEGPSDYLLEADLYLLLAAALIQSLVAGSLRHAGRAMPLLTNLIGPLLYTLLEAPFHDDFFAAPHHIAYWLFSLAIAVVQQLQLASPRLRTPLLLLEHLIRTTILLVMYIILEALTGNYQSLSLFLADESHLFVAIVVPILGLVIGSAHLTAERNLSLLRETAGQLREYSEWLLGRELLSQAVDRPEVLRLTRQERVVLFMDIRGFTGWSEERDPEQVVEMINGYYAAGERVWSQARPIKVKHTADELMLVFATATEALDCATGLRREVTLHLNEHGLSAGIGLHVGPLVEGLIGSGSLMAFDVLGDTANCAKRICSAAAGGEILLSEPLLNQLSLPFTHGQRITLRGRDEGLLVAPLSDDTVRT